MESGSVHQRKFSLSVTDEENNTVYSINNDHPSPNAQSPSSSQPMPPRHPAATSPPQCNRKASGIVSPAVSSPIIGSMDPPPPRSIDNHSTSTTKRNSSSAINASAASAKRGSGCGPAADEAASKDLMLLRLKRTGTGTYSYSSIAKFQDGTSPLAVKIKRDNKEKIMVDSDDEVSGMLRYSRLVA